MEMVCSGDDSFSFLHLITVSLQILTENPAYVISSKESFGIVVYLYNIIYD